MNKTILIVDDDDRFLNLIVNRLKERGFNAHGVTSGKDAVNFANEHDVNIAIIDISMPEMDGFTTLRALKSINKNIQVIMLTGYGSIQKGLHSLKEGAVDFIEKPVDLNALTDTIKHILSRIQ